jgi:hypothetical protein
MIKYVLPVLTAVALHAGIIGLFLFGYRGDLSALVCVGGDREAEAPYAAIRTLFREGGYDGQFYYAIAQAPFRRHEVGIDFPPMRQSRILYPFLCWVSSGGDADRLLWAMPLVNLLAIGGLAALGVGLTVRFDLNPWWGLTLPLAVNPALPLLRDLGDAVSTVTVGLLLVAWLCRWPWWAVAVGGLTAVLSREQNVPIVSIVLGLAAWRRQWITVGSLLGVLVVWGGWIATLWHMYDVWPFHPTRGAFDHPFEGLWLRLSNFQPKSVDGICVTMILVQIALSVYLIRRAVEPAVVLVALFGSLLAVMGGSIFYGDFWSYARVFAMLPLAVWIGCAQIRHRWLLAVTAVQFLAPLRYILDSLRASQLI